MSLLKNFDLRYSDWNKTDLKRTILRTLISIGFVLLLVFFLSFDFNEVDEIFALNFLMKILLPQFVVGFFLFGISRRVFHSFGITNKEGENYQFVEIGHLAKDLKWSSS